MIKIDAVKNNPLVQLPLKAYYIALGSLSVLKEDSEKFIDRAYIRGSDLQADALSKIDQVTQKILTTKSKTPQKRKVGLNKTRRSVRH